MSRIAYVTYVRRDAVGIVRKVEQQARAAEAVSLDGLDFFILQHHRSGRSGNLNYVKIIPRPQPIDYYERMFSCYQIIDRSVDLSSYDYVVLRYPSADVSGIEFAKKHRIITEHHTDELAEFHATSMTDLPLARRALGVGRYLLEKTYGSRILENCEGIIGVTDEIRSIELRRIKRDLPSTTISNGVDVDTIDMTGFEPFDGRRLELVMVASQPKSAWIGLDRVIQSLAAFSGTVEVRLHIVGEVARADQAPLLSRYPGLVFHGQKQGDDLDRVMREKTLAIGTMSLHRNGMNEACSLKTREYTARGIPFILAYRDPDLAAAQSERAFHREFANDESLIDIDEVIDFAATVSRTGSSLSHEMRTFALDHMDWRAKMPRYMDLVREIKRSRAAPRS